MPAKLRSRIDPCYTQRRSESEPARRIMAAHGSGHRKVRCRVPRAAAALRAAQVPYAIVGGNAVAAWVSRVDEAAVRNTRDVNTLVRRPDLEKIRAALEAHGFIYRQLSLLGRPGKLDLFLDGPTA